MGAPPRRILVVGGAGGIGLACAERFAARGDAVIVASRHTDRVRERFGAHDDVRFAVLDATDHAAVAQLFESHGPIDHVVVTVAGGVYMGPFVQMDAAGLASTLNGKLVPYLNVIAVAGTAITAAGSITLVTGLAGQRAAPSAASLAIVNGALESLVYTLAVELAPRRINAVSPGTTATSAWDRMPTEARDAFFARAATRTPLGRVGRPEDVAAAVAAVVDLEFVTGAVLPVDGGAVMA